MVRLNSGPRDYSAGLPRSLLTRLAERRKSD